MSKISVSINPIIAAFIIACGEWNGSQWEYFPKLPSCFCEKITFYGGHTNADLLRLCVNDQLGVECWFIDENENMFWLDLDDIKKSHSFLWVAIVTHIYDMIENFEEE